MSLAFSRRSFLKYSAVAAVAVAGASLFSGCESQGDTKNLYCDGAGSITVLQINAVLGTYDKDAKKYKDIDLTGNTATLPFTVTNGRVNALSVNVQNFKAIVYDANGKQKAKYNYMGGLRVDKELIDTNLKNGSSVNGNLIVTMSDPLAEGEKLVLTYTPDTGYEEYSMNWVLARAAKKEESAGSTTTK